MPTGYTADVADGKVTDFRTFALRCSRAFGATIMQRDNPMDELPQHRVESDFYARELDKDVAELTRFQAMSDAEAQMAMEAEAADIRQQRDEYQAEKAEKRARYEAMLTEVERWEAPTPDHINFKDFMRKQLLESIDFDCSDFIYPKEPTITDAVLWRLGKCGQLARDIARDREEIAKERERCRNANAWIDALYESLGEQVPA